MTSASTTRKRKPGTIDEVGLALARRGRASVGSSAGLERARDGGADRDDAAALAPRARATAAAVSAGSDEALGVDAVVARRRSTSTGRKVPGPTWSTTSARSMPRAARRSRSARREVQARGRRGDAAGLARVDGLVALAVRGRVGAADVGRQRHVAVRARARVDVAVVRRSDDRGAAGGQERRSGAAEARLDA